MCPWFRAVHDCALGFHTQATAAVGQPAVRSAMAGVSQFQVQSIQHWRPDDSSTLRGCSRTQRFDEEDAPSFPRVSLLKPSGCMRTDSAARDAMAARLHFGAAPRCSTRYRCRPSGGSTVPLPHVLVAGQGAPGGAAGSTRGRVPHQGAIRGPRHDALPVRPRPVALRRRSASLRLPHAAGLAWRGALRGAAAQHRPAFQPHQHGCDPLAP